MLRRTLLQSLPIALASLPIAPVAMAQDKAADYPSRLVTILVPYAAGGTSDMFARLLSDELSKSLGQRFLVENKPGASGNIGTEQLARATPDGYTLGIGTVATHTINPLIFKKLPFALSDFAPVSLIATLPNVLVVNPKIEAKLGSGADRAAQGQAGRAHLRLLRRGHLAARVRRAVHGPHRHPHDARALQGQRPADHGRCGGPRGPVV